MTASTPRRSASACHSSSASPTRDAASSASTSSHVPGKRTTPNLTLLRVAVPRLPVLSNPSRSSCGLYLVVLDQRVGEQPLAHLGQARRVLHVELDEPAD